MTYVDHLANGGRSEVKNASNILFYETGLANVPSVDTNTYVPGALADYLTSSAPRRGRGSCPILPWALRWAGMNSQKAACRCVLCRATILP